MYRKKFPLHYAAAINDLYRMRYLLDHQRVPVDSLGLDSESEYACTPLHYVRTKEAAEILINNKCDLDARDSEGATPLMAAVDNRLPDVAIFLIESGADVNCCDHNNWNALHHFVCSLPYYRDYDYDYDRDLWKLLVSKVSDIDAVSNKETGDTALSMAAPYGHREIVNLLIQSGASVSIGFTSSWTFFHSAACKGWTEIAETIANEFDVDVATYDGFTALMLAAKNKHYDMVDLLLEWGADIYLKNDYNAKALSLAVPHVELIVLLVNNGAYLEHSDYTKIHGNTLCREQILKNTELCTQIVINEYNNLCLPKVYQLYSSVKKLPKMDNLKIRNRRSIIGEIEKSVDREIKRKTFCDVTDLRPPVLQMMAVRSLIANQFLNDLTIYKNIV